MKISGPRVIPASVDDVTDTYVEFYHSFRRFQVINKDLADNTNELPSRLLLALINVSGGFLRLIRSGNLLCTLVYLTYLSKLDIELNCNCKVYMTKH